MNLTFSSILKLVGCLAFCLPSIMFSQNSLNFDGGDDYVQTTFGGVIGSTDRTFEAWIFLDSSATGNQAILDYGVNAAGSRNTFSVGGNKQLSFVSGGTNANLSSPSFVIPLETWTHVAFVLDAGTGYMYVNGIQVATGSLISVNTPGTGTNLRIGQRVPGGNISFVGSIDEVRVWNVARTAAELMADMNTEYCTPPADLMAYYKFNQGVAGGTNTGLTTLPDDSGFGNAGTLTNFALTGATSNWATGVTLNAGAVAVVLNETACDDFTSPSGKFLWTASGTYLDTVSTPGACDSFFTVNLILDPVTATFSTTSATTLCPGTSVTFQDASTGGTAYTWLADMTPFSQTAQASYTFADTGTVEIMLVVSNATCSDTSTMTFIISGPAISNAFISDESCVVGLDGSIDIDVVGGVNPFTYSWSNGAMTQDLTGVPGGTYTVTVTDGLGCSTTETYTVSSTLDVVAGFITSSDASLCPGETITFTNTSQMATAYDWQIDGQSFATSTDLTYTFPASGEILVELIASEGNCTDTTSLSFYVNEAPQIVSTVTGESCPGSLDGAIDLQLTGGSTPFTFAWSNLETTEDLTGLSIGNYEVTITDTAGCTIKDTFEIMTLGGVDAAFSYSYAATGIQFLDESLADTTVTSWYWDFGTGVASDTSDDQSPLFTYPISGTFEVCLKIEDMFGCADSICELVTYSVGIDPALYQSIDLYPNPNDGHFFLDLSEVTNQEVQLEVFDLLGKQVYTAQFRASTQVEVDLSGLAEGVYHLRVLAEEGYFRTKMIVE